LAIGTFYWWLDITVGVVTFKIMFVADSFPDVEREEKQQDGRPRRSAEDEVADQELQPRHWNGGKTGYGTAEGPESSGRPMLCIVVPLCVSGSTRFVGS